MEIFQKRGQTLRHPGDGHPKRKGCSGGTGILLIGKLQMRGNEEVLQKRILVPRKKRKVNTEYRTIGNQVVGW